ncbi:uncharacterized protein LOC132042487 [Lycium ferocissimum]|uniref:uncharacterized protein LOC132042487 n=1 Tax=Lycium ferocissimum TaxID=112874 RepID=UPI0028158BDD|nr:uncharacterized protein LOC132042487 [Lycium ferocissimum]
MNFYTGGSSNNNDENSSSSSSSLDLDDTIAEEQQVILQNIWMNNYMLQYLQEYQNNEVFRVGSVPAHDTYFEQHADAMGRFGLSIVQKITAVFRMLAYGLPADATDEYVKIRESTAIESMKRFCRAIVEVFGQPYLRSPTANDVARLLHIGEQRGFPGMLGSLDCMHCRWKNCATAWAGQYAGRSGSPTIILEAGADYDLWIWHAYFGPSRFWRKEVLHDILTSCIILHNMIIEDERDLNAPIQDAWEGPTPTVEMVVDENYRFEQFLARHKKIKNKDAHFALRNALVEHLWEQRTNHGS